MEKPEAPENGYVAHSLRKIPLDWSSVWARVCFAHFEAGKKKLGLGNGGVDTWKLERKSRFVCGIILGINRKKESVHFPLSKIWSSRIGALAHKGSIHPAWYCLRRLSRDQSIASFQLNHIFTRSFKGSNLSSWQILRCGWFQCRNMRVSKPSGHAQISWRPHGHFSFSFRVVQPSERTIHSEYGFQRKWWSGDALSNYGHQGKKNKMAMDCRVDRPTTYGYLHISREG